jgi:hypothetical protein
MPAKSKKQQAFIFAHPEKFGGKKKVEKEWAQSGAAYEALPEHVSDRKEKPKMYRHTTRPRQS